MAEPLRVLCVMAHPDDVEFGAAGSVAIWVDQGAEVTYVIVTDGSTGTSDAGLVGDKLAEIRREETVRAAKVVGVENVIFLGYRDGYVEPTLDLRRDLAREFRKARPERMVTMDPQSLPGGWFVNHPDHRAIGQAALDITVTAGTTPGHFPELLEEGHEPWRGLREIFLFGPGGGPFAVDITDSVDRKIEALRCHESQIGDWDVGTMIRGWTAENGREHGYAYAERFQKLGTMEAVRSAD
jgi:LmbE family N-acetylglucosaminyl deacetylase